MRFKQPFNGRLSPKKMNHTDEAAKNSAVIAKKDKVDSDLSPKHRIIFSHNISNPVSSRCCTSPNGSSPLLPTTCKTASLLCRRTETPSTLQLATWSCLKRFTALDRTAESARRTSCSANSTASPPRGRTTQRDFFTCRGAKKLGNSQTIVIRAQVSCFGRTASSLSAFTRKKS